MEASARPASSKRVDGDEEAQQSRYDACLERTTDEVCEVHWVRRPDIHRDEVSGAVVVTTDGEVGTAIGF